jgi:hypothetical protein
MSFPKVISAVALAGALSFSGIAVVSASQLSDACAAIEAQALASSITSDSTSDGDGQGSPDPASQDYWNSPTAYPTLLECREVAAF